MPTSVPINDAPPRAEHPPDADRHRDAAAHSLSGQIGAAAVPGCTETPVRVPESTADCPGPQRPSKPIRGFSTRNRAKFVGLAGLLWLAFLVVGFYSLAREEFTPAAESISTAKFPSSSTLALAPDSPTLILFAHPHCPCTRASLREFDGLLAAVPRRVTATIVFPLPNGVPPHWEQGDLWRSAARVPGVRVVLDPDGREARRFGVKASGHVLLYEPSGDLVFSGGITPSRGHEGDNPGRSAVIDLINGGRAAVHRTPVFGCPLLDDPSSML